MRNRILLGLALTLGMSGLVFGQANVAGKWAGTVAGRGGEQPITLELTVSGTTITGKLTTGQGMPVDITNAKLEGNKLTFSAAGGGGGGRGGGGGGAPGGGAPPAGAPPAGGGAPGGGGGGGGRGGGGVQNFEATVNGAEMSVTRTPAAPAGGAPAAAAPPAGGAPAGGGGGGRGGGGPVTFTLKKA